MPMNSAHLESTVAKSAPLVPAEPHVKSAESRKLFNAGVRGNSKTGKSVDPTCYNAGTVELGTGLFDNVERDMPSMKQVRKVWKKSIGDTIAFKVSGYEIADCRNPNPAPVAVGTITGKLQDGFIPVWCKRENREGTTIMVAIDNVMS